MKVDAHVGATDKSIGQDEQAIWRGSHRHPGPRPIKRKFSRATPGEQTEAYFRVLEGCPSGKRVEQDVRKVLVALVEIFKAKGAAVRGDKDHKGGGREHIKKGTGSGGARKKGQGRKPDQWMHEHCKGASEARIQVSVGLAAKKEEE